MADAPPVSTDASSEDLGTRLEALGRSLAQREAAHREGLEQARERAEQLRDQVSRVLERFNRAAAAAGAPHLQVEVSPVRVDDKHVRSVEFELERGRHKAIVLAKSKGEVTLVGPFRTGKVEGPCLSFPFDAEEELSQALAGFLERFVEEAATP